MVQRRNIERNLSGRCLEGLLEWGEAQSFKIGWFWDTAGRGLIVLSGVVRILSGIVQKLLKGPESSGRPALQSSNENLKWLKTERSKAV